MLPIHNRSKAGFTLIEVTLAVVIISILIAVIVPRALRANVDAKYAGVRQAAAEIGPWGNDWATRNLEAQTTDAFCNLNDYIETLQGYVGNTTGPNWVSLTGANIDLNTGCRNNTGGIGYTVDKLIPSGSQPRNPFNGASYFNVSGANDNSRIQAGILYLGFYVEQSNGIDLNNYYFVYTGTDSTSVSQWHAGMGTGTPPSEAGLRNGVFMARQAVRQ
jgi:prepilin-type N-terminal cleavage/methylation domain-containing protein